MRITPPRFLRVTLFALAASPLFACADEPASPTETTAGDGAYVLGTAGGALTAPSAAPHAAIVSDFLRQRSRGAAVDGLRVTAEIPAREGVSHLRMEQVVDGRRVVGAYVKAAISERGELLHLIEKLVPVQGAVHAARIGERAALEAALVHLGYEIPTPFEVGREGRLTRFSKRGVFYRAPTVERVVFADDSGALREGFMVETWSDRENQLDHTLVDGAGAIISVERRTNNDSYKVFAESPDEGDQVDVINPADPTASPNGWLKGASQFTTNITGHNVLAYLDTDANNSPDASANAVTDGVFGATADLDVAPSAPVNRAVAVQNLFYLNNVMHDVLFAHGFTPANGNFEGNDPVKAEAQDGSGTDNANMSTPSDGSSPRMQMYLWSGADPDALVAVSNGPTFDAFAATFGGALTTAGVTAPLALYTDASAPFNDACGASTTSLSGKIALVERGTCNFTDKVLNAQKAGAIGVIVANNVAGERAFAMGGTERRIKIPSGMVTFDDGQTLRTSLATSVTLRRNPEPPLMIDGDLDADIVFHEYGHGLTWRMIGNMSGPLAGAIGEGASDVLAFLMNGDDRIGEYAYSDPAGIRRYRYANYPLSYGDVTGAEVHDDGEIYAAAMWAVLQAYQGAGLTASDVLHDFVQGMLYTPSGPAFEDMRDGMLQAVPDARDCLIWRGFATVGIGVGADGTVSRRGKVTITESTAVPTECEVTSSE